MKVELLTITPDAEKLIEQAGRTAYQSFDRITDESAATFIKMLVKRGHTSVLEHASATFKISDVSRAFSHQLVRHRLSSYTQKSQRYCRFGDKPELEFVHIDGESTHGHCKFTIPEEMWICSKYKEGYTLDDIASHLEIHNTTVYAMLKKHNYEIRKNDASSKGINQDFFNKIDTPEKAYILGFIVADGCISCNRNQITIDQAKESFNIVDVILNMLKPKGKLHKYNAINDNCQDIYRMYVCSEQLTIKLKEFGFSGHKNIDTRKIYNIIPNEFKKLFLRGVFDGDGHINITHNDAVFMIAGNYNTCELFREILSNHLNKNINENKINIDENNNCRLSYGGKPQVTKIVEYLYDIPLCLFYPKKLWRAAQLSDKIKSVYNSSILEYSNLFEFVTPSSITIDYKILNLYIFSIYQMRNAYKNLSSCGIKNEDARFVLPNAISTEIVITTNFREWRHIIGLRTDKTTQWEIREVCMEILKILKENAPSCFGDINE